MPKIYLTGGKKFYHDLETYASHRHHEIVYCPLSADISQQAHEQKPDLFLFFLDSIVQDQKKIFPLLLELGQSFPFFLIGDKKYETKFIDLIRSPRFRGFYQLPGNFKQLFLAIDGILLSEPFTNDEEVVTLDMLAGQYSDKFSLEECLGEGTFGSVYLGQYRNDKVAIKILSKAKLSEEIILRFERETQILQTLKHENIVELIATGRLIDNTYYMVMEYFPGENLDDLLENKKFFSPDEATNIILQVAKGMCEAHACHVIHRDLKPSNILYQPQTNKAKIVDFGLVKRTNLAHSITRTGYIMGTPYYMSPEQCEGKILDIRTDIYSLGITFYQLLTGIVPFDRTSQIETLLAHLHDPLIWPTQFIFQIPFTIRKIVGKMVAKQPNDRYQNMQEVVEALIEKNNKHYS